MYSYIPGQHDSSINIKIVHMATTHTDFMRIVTTKANFIVNRTML